MNRFLLDTNHLSDAIQRVSVVRDRIQQQHRHGSVFGTCGIVQRRDATATERRLAALLQLLRVWPIDPDSARRYGIVYPDLKKAGRALSQVDMMLAAMCRHLPATLLTTDQDFQAVPGIVTENWLESKP